MNDIDRKIQAALQRDAANHPDTDELNVAEQMIATFRGRRRWLSMLGFSFSLAALIGTVWAALRFYQAETVVAQIQWAGLAFMFLLMLAMLKLWFWLELNTNRVLREVKRIELLLVTRRPD